MQINKVWLKRLMEESQIDWFRSKSPTTFLSGFPTDHVSTVLYQMAQKTIGKDRVAHIPSQNHPDNILSSEEQQVAIEKDLTLIKESPSHLIFGDSFVVGEPFFEHLSAWSNQIDCHIFVPIFGGVNNWGKLIEKSIQEQKEHRIIGMVQNSKGVVKLGVVFDPHKRDKPSKKHPFPLHIATQQPKTPEFNHVQQIALLSIDQVAGALNDSRPYVQIHLVWYLTRLLRFRRTKTSEIEKEKLIKNTLRLVVLNLENVLYRFDNKNPLIALLWRDFENELWSGTPHFQNH